VGVIVAAAGRHSDRRDEENTVREEEARHLDR
jgi:hypothetical protein